MKVSGFTFVRNAIALDYPLVESLCSILTLCDELVIAVGKSEDNTLELVKSIDSEKIKIIETVWDDNLRQGGQILAQQTNAAFQAINPEADWAFYLQADEVVHEQDLASIHQAMLRWKDDPKVEGLLFNYIHFFGSYDYYADSRQWYRKEIRVIKNDPDIFSYQDAQGFRKKPNRKLRVKELDACIYHYGWVREPRKQSAKQRAFHRLWHDDEYLQKQPYYQDIPFDYSSVDSLARFTGRHPKVMRKRIAHLNWEFQPDIQLKNYSPRVRWLMWIEQLTGWRIGEYKNYRKI